MKIRLRRPRLARTRAALAAVVIATLAATALIATAPPASAAISIDTSTWYVIVNANSGKAIDLYNWSTNDGVEFRQWTRTDATNQQFQFVSSGGGYYRMKNRHSGKVVDVWGWSTADGGEVNQYSDLNAANQQWMLTGANNSAVRFINRHSGKAMEVYNWSTADGGDIVQWTDYGAANQTWNLVAVGSGDPTGPPSTADLTVNTGAAYQTIDGFGAATPIWGGTWSTAETQTLVGLGANQLGLSIVRTGIPPVSSEWSVNTNALRTAKSYGSGVKILASPWTAPAAWKTNNSRINGGKLRTDYYDDYAYHLNNYVQYMNSQGVGIDVTSVQNEPDWHPSYDSMDWSGEEMRNFVRDHGSKVQNTRLMVAEAVNFNYSYSDPTLNDATARNNIGYIGGHNYGTEDSGRLRPYTLAEQHNKPVWMTEWNYHEADGSGSNIWGDPTNQAAWDETLDDIMRQVHKSMESNWNAWIWWYGKRYYSFIGDGESAFGTTAGAPLKRGYAFSQFSKYVRPGYQRIGVSKSSKASPLEVTAYRGDGNKIVLVILNRSNSAVNGAVVQAPQNISSAQYIYTSRWQSQAPQPTSLNGSQVTVDVGARSISTVVLTL